jgi:hypothetical protein
VDQKEGNRNSRPKPTIAFLLTNIGVTGQNYQPAHPGRDNNFNGLYR